MLAPALGARPMEATAILMAVATTDRVTMPRVRLLCSPFTGGGTAAVSAVATADMVAAMAAAMVAGADGSSVLAFR